MPPKYSLLMYCGTARCNTNAQKYRDRGNATQCYITKL